MWQKAPGRMAPDLYLLGTSKNPIYLTGSGDEWILIEGGLQWMSPLVLQQIDAVLPSRQHVRHWLLTHAHYDHCAMLGQLHAEMPWVRVHVGAATAAALKSARAREVVQTLNAQVRLLPEYAQGTVPARCAGGLAAPVPLDEVPVDVVADGTALAFAQGRSIRVIATPGHSRCSTTFFDEHTGRAFVSDALGELLEPHHFCPLAFDDLTEYRRSLDKIGDLGARMVILAHHAVLTDEYARVAPADASRGIDSFVCEARQLLIENGGDVEVASRSLSQRFIAISAEFVPPALHVASMKRMINLLRAEGSLHVTE